MKSFVENKLKIVLILLFLSISLFVFAATDTEIQYPTIPGAPAPTATTTFPAYVKYLFNFAIIIAGLIALAVLVWAGVLYLSSAGDPNKINEAKSKSVGAFLGLILLLSSYLILTTINPQLAGISLPPVPPVAGVYLIDTAGNKKFVATDISKFSFKNATSVEFVSATSSLMEVYLYDGENFTGTRERVTASSTLVTLSGAEIKSIYLLWNRPGIYLYDLINFQLSNNTPYPLYVSGFISNLGSLNFDNKAQSLKFNSLGKRHGTVLFTNLDYQGQCAYAQDVSGGSPFVVDLSIYQSNYISTPIGLNTLSSLAVFNVSDVVPGDVTFFYEINCVGNKKTYTPGFGALFRQRLDLEMFDTATTTPLDRNILSFQINGNFGVALTTEQLLAGKCQLFFKPQDTNCFDSIKGKSVYDPDPAGDKVKSLLIFPLSF